MDQPAAQAEDLAVAVDRELQVPELVALLVGAEEILAPVLDPFDRAAEHARRGGDARIFRIEAPLGPKPPPTSGVMTCIW